MSVSVAAWLGRFASGNRLAGAVAPIFDAVSGRPFSAAALQRVQIYQTRSRIGFSQTYPFLRHAPDMRWKQGVEIRCADIERLLNGDLAPAVADVVLLQPWFDVNRAALVRALEHVRSRNPDARIILLDGCAHSDLRLARHVDPFVDCYVKKSVFRDRGQYLHATRGDTNLTDYLGAQYGYSEAEVDWQTPRSVLPKLIVGPGFVTAPGLFDGFLRAAPDFIGPRPIDLHARLATQGSGWYAAMRKDAATRASELPGHTVTGTGVSRRVFLRELLQSKMVFSPFGYGELCWRDVEGFLTGAVVIKQDMSHLDTRPDLFRPWETYVPVAWDFSDLEANFARLYHDDKLRHRIANEAWRTVRTYLELHLQNDLEAILFSGSERADAVQPGGLAPEPLEAA
ncbi:MAG: glycosyltransferase family 1 protein [Paracoccaceae bacterium]